MSFTVVKDSYPNIVKDGLVLNVDAGSRLSYSGSGTTWTSLVGSGIGTLKNGPTYDSANGGSILFDGTNDYMSFSGFTCDRQYYSIDWWSRPTAVSNYDNMILMNSSGIEEAYWNGFTTHSTTSGQLYIGHTGAAAVINGIYVNGTWNNLTWTFSNGTSALYKNGSLVSSGSLAAYTSDYTFLQIGAGPGFSQGTLFDGSCSSLRVYSGKALTASEVSQNFNALRGRYGI